MICYAKVKLSLFLCKGKNFRTGNSIRQQAGINMDVISACRFLFILVQGNGFAGSVFYGMIEG